MLRLERGFTLLEVLIAITITAMIGVGSTQLLSSIIDARRATEIRAEQLASLQRFNMVVSRDIEQIINRSIRDDYGDIKEALLLDSSEYPLEFTRTGWRNNPFAEDPRAELQRVAYKLEALSSDACDSARKRLENWGIIEAKGECLVRYFWPVLDRAPNSKPLAQVVLEQVDALNIEIFVGSRAVDPNGAPVTGKPNGDWFSAWPALDSNTDNAATPMAMRWTIRLPALGEIERLWLLAWGADQ